MSELKPCPLCGGTRIFMAARAKQGAYECVADAPDVFRLYCFDCQHGYYDTEEEAVDAWNRRAELGSGTCEYCRDGTFDGQTAMMSNHGWQKVRYCPNCGAKVKVSE